MNRKYLTPFALTILLACAAEPSRPAPSGKGRVLILENERTLEGDIEQVGSQYRIRRTVGETWVPGEKVIALCNDVEGAYRVLRARANLRDPDEHLRLAQWCRLNRLPAQALTEVEEAVKLRPDHSQSRWLLRHLQQAAKDRPATMPNAPREEPEPMPLPPVDLTEEALGQFVSQVQPILMNACAACHASGKGGSFRLTRIYDGVSLNRKAMQQNLSAVLAQVNVSQPSASPLLSKAVSVHGDLSQSPLKSRQAAAYRKLDDWVRRTVANNPQVQREPVTPVVSQSTGPEARSVPTTPVQPIVPVGSNPPPTSPPATTPMPKKEETPPDPFDPDAFNRQGSKPASTP